MPAGCCFSVHSMFNAIPWASKMNNMRRGTRSEHRTVRDVEGPALGIGPSVILDVSADDFSSGWQQSVIWNFSWEIPPAAVTKRAERGNGGARAACFKQPEDVYSGCGDARPAKYTFSYSVTNHPRYRSSAWKVPLWSTMKYVALLETSPRCAVYQLRANLRFARSDYDTIHDVCIRRGRSWILNLGRHRIGF